jgi:hypothetical protein
MASKADQSVRLSPAGLIVGGLALALVAIAVAMAISTFRPNAGVGQGKPQESQTGTGAAPVFVGEPLPAPLGEAIVAVLDPAVEAPAISADEAIALAREIVPNQVGKSPRAQLVQMTSETKGSWVDGFTGWIILSTDIIGQSHDPYYASPTPIYATYTWVYVSLDGEVLGTSKDLYDGPEFVPPLPDD